MGIQHQNADNKSAQCDVVNGGFNQKAYLLFPAQNETIAHNALAEYRRRISPFKEREARFRETIGPPLLISVNPKLTANLQFMEDLSSSDIWHPAPSSAGDQEDTSPDPPSEDSSLNSIETTQSNALPPAGDQKSKQPHTDTGHLSENSSAVGSTKSGMSSSTAKFFELDKAFKRQQSDNDARDKQSSERMQQLERQQLSRFEDIDKKLDSVKQSVSGQLDSFKDSLLQSLSATPSAPDPTIQALEQKLSSLMTIVQDIASTSRASPDPMFSTPRRRKKSKPTGKLSSPASRNNGDCYKPNVRLAVSARF